MTSRNTLENIRIVLIHTSHPGNIGSTARAMKTMGLNKLYLVNPKSFPDEQAVTMSSNASDVLDKATVVDTLQEAISDCQLVVGTSARHERSLRWQITNSHDCAKVLIKQTKTGGVAIVFGRENTGLTNDELAMCHQLVHIPTNPEYSSLNIASAVQILAYECRMALFSTSSSTKNTDMSSKKLDKMDVLATTKEVEGYYQHLEKMMIESDFLDPVNPRHLMNRLRRLYGRIRMTRSEVNILRGILSSFQRKDTPAKEKNIQK